MWELDYKESWAPKNWCSCAVVFEKTLESPLDCKEIKLVNPKGNQPWIFNGRSVAEAETPIFQPPEELTHWKRPWCWERLKAGKEGDNRGWDGWMASQIQWTWVLASSRSGWWTGKAGVLGVVKSQTRLSDWTELNSIFESSMLMIYPTPNLPIKYHHIEDKVSTSEFWGDTNIQSVGVRQDKL